MEAVVHSRRGLGRGRPGALLTLLAAVVMALVVLGGLPSSARAASQTFSCVVLPSDPCYLEYPRAYKELHVWYTGDAELLVQGRLVFENDLSHWWGQGTGKSNDGSLLKLFAFRYHSYYAVIFQYGGGAHTIWGRAIW